MFLIIFYNEFLIDPCVKLCLFIGFVRSQNALSGWSPVSTVTWKSHTVSAKNMKITVAHALSPAFTARAM